MDALRAHGTGAARVKIGQHIRKKTINKLVLKEKINKVLKEKNKQADQ